MKFTTGMLVCCLVLSSFFIFRVPPASGLGGTSLGIDGSNIATCSNATASCSASLSTTKSNDVIVVFASETLDVQTSCTFGVSDTAGLTWIVRSPVVFGRNNHDQLQEWWAKSSGVLTSDSITESISGCGPNYNGLQVFAISGANVNSPFDPNAALPGTGSDGSSGQQSLTSASISTNNPTDMLFAGVQHGTGAVANPGSGFTSIISTGGYGAEYEITGASLTNFAVTFSFSISSYWQMIADAVVPALTIDGSAIATCSNSTTSCSATLSTSNMNDIVIVYASETLDVQTSCTFSVSDTAGLTWAARGGIVFGRSNGVSYRDQLQEFWAKSSAILTSDSITESISGCGPNYNGLQVFAISGANFNYPFDPNSGLPDSGSDSSSGQQSLTSATVSTNNPNDIVFAGVQHGTGAVANPGSGFTSIISTGGYGTEYQLVGGTLSNFAVTFSFSMSSYFQMIADAIVPAGITPFGFSLSSSPASANVVKGDSVTSTISVSLTQGTPQTVALSQTGCPPSATCSFYPSSGSPSFSSILTVATTSSTPVGSYTIIVTGSGGGTSQTSYAITVTPSLGDFWGYTGSGSAYFERQSYTTPYSAIMCPDGIGNDPYCYPVHEVAPVQVDANTIYMYYRTYYNSADKKNPSNGEIGLTYSTDGGASFNLWNNGSPVVSRGDVCYGWDGQEVVAPSVVIVNGVFYMVYEGRNTNGLTNCPIDTGDIGLATSTDGKIWAKYGIIISHGLGFEFGNIGTPSIQYFNGEFYVFYHGFDTVRSKIGFAHGTNIYALQKNCCNPVMDDGKGPSSWDSYVNSRGSIIWDAASGYYYMSFEGSQSKFATCMGGNWGWGIARSTDLNNWEKYAFNPIRQTYQSGCGNDLPYIFKFNGQIYVYQREQGQRNILSSGTDRYLTVYLSVNGGQGQCELYHHEGRVDGDGWAANTVQDGQGHMCYGPYVSTLPGGKYTVNFRDMIDNNNADDYPVISHDIYDDTTGSIAVQHTVLRNDFADTYVYQNFNQQFINTSPHSYEFRTWYYDIAYIRQFMVSVRQIG